MVISWVRDENHTASPSSSDVPSKTITHDTGGEGVMLVPNDKDVDAIQQRGTNAPGGICDG